MRAKMNSFNTTRDRLPRRFTTGLLLFVAFHAAIAAAQAAEPLVAQSLETAAQMVRASGAPGGVIAVLGGANADLPLALGKQGSFVVQCLTADEASCAKLRTSIRAHGMYGPVSANTLDGERLPYAGNLVNILVITAEAPGNKAGLTAKDLLRVLAPLGTAFVAQSPAADPLAAALKAAGATVAADAAPAGWTVLKKPWPANIDQWTH
jgi:hypothetical protein